MIGSMSAGASPELRIESDQNSSTGVAILKVVGPLTIRNFFEFQDTARSSKAPLLIIDLGGVPFMDSAALGSVLGLHVSCEKNGRKYALVNVSARLETLFAVCGVKDVLVTFPTANEAMAELG